MDVGKVVDFGIFLDPLEFQLEIVGPIEQFHLVFDAEFVGIVAIGLVFSLDQRFERAIGALQVVHAQAKTGLDVTGVVATGARQQQRIAPFA